LCFKPKAANTKHILLVLNKTPAEVRVMPDKDSFGFITISAQVSKNRKGSF